MTGRKSRDRSHRPRALLLVAEASDPWLEQRQHRRHLLPITAPGALAFAIEAARDLSGAWSGNAASPGLGGEIEQASVPFEPDKGAGGAGGPLEVLDQAFVAHEVLRQRQQLAVELGQLHDRI